MKSRNDKVARMRRRIRICRLSCCRDMNLILTGLAWGMFLLLRMVLCEFYNLFPHSVGGGDDG